MIKRYPSETNVFTSKRFPGIQLYNSVLACLPCTGYDAYWMRAWYDWIESSDRLFYFFQLSSIYGYLPQVKEREREKKKIFVNFCKYTGSTAANFLELSITNSRISLNWWKFLRVLFNYKFINHMYTAEKNSDIFLNIAMPK